MSNEPKSRSGREHGLVQQEYQKFLDALYSRPWQDAATCVLSVPLFGTCRAAMGWAACYAKNSFGNPFYALRDAITIAADYPTRLEEGVAVTRWDRNPAVDTNTARVFCIAHQLLEIYSPRQCKDIDEIPILQLIAINEQETSTWTILGGNDEPGDRRTIMSILGNYPRRLVLAKMRNLIERRGLVDGCACGCSGGFTLTDKGRAHLAEKLGVKS